MHAADICCLRSVTATGKYSYLGDLHNVIVLSTKGDVPAAKRIRWATTAPPHLLAVSVCVINLYSIACEKKIYTTVM